MKLAPFALAGLLATPALAAEAPPVPVCAQPEVLARVAETLGRAGRVIALEPFSVGEVPGLRPDTVACAVRVHRRVTDTGRSIAPYDVVSVFQYRLELRRNGVFFSARPDAAL